MIDNKQQLIEQVHQWRTDWDALVKQVGAQRMDEPRRDGGWTFKDLAAHLGYWWGYEASRLESAASGVPPLSTVDVEQQNQSTYERNKNRPAADLLADAESALDRLERAFNALPDQALFEKDRYPWAEGLALGPEVVSVLDKHLYDEHGADIDYWRSHT